MNILTGITRLSKGLKEESDPDAIQTTKAIISGMTNFYFRKNGKFALEMYEKHCSTCPMNVEDPVKSMRVEDTEIPELSNRMCKDCGCTLSFKNRQNIKPCYKWTLNSK